jgi:hypothetical protein
VALLAVAFAVAQAQQPAPPKPADRTKEAIEAGPKVVIAQPQPPSPAPNPEPDLKDVRKRMIERPTEDVIARALAEAAKRSPKDVGKGRIERPTEDVLATARAAALAEAARTENEKGFVNPKVAPGKVNWHKDFAGACSASAQSGKPVLLFQMMGKLDDKFC